MYGCISKMRKRVLVLLGGYYPSYGAPGIVFEKMLPVLREHYEITILTPRRVAHDLGSFFTYNGVFVHEISDWINDRVVENSRRGLVPLALRFMQRIWWVCQKQPMFTYSIRNTLKCAERLHRECVFDAVISVSFPPYTHIAAATFKARHPELKWVAYSTDTLFDHKVLRSKWHKLFMQDVLSWEMQAYSHADCVFFTPEIYAWRNRMFPNGEVSPLLLNYLLSLPVTSDTPLDVAARHDANDTIHFVYAGVFYERTRDPSWFADVMRELIAKNDNFLFDFYLVTDACKDVIEAVAKDFPQNVFIRPPVQPSEVTMIMRSADFLLNFSNDADQFSPSKIFDYVATGRPILNVAYPNRKVNDVLLRNPLSLTVVNDGDVHKSAKEVEAFIVKNGGERLGYDELRSLYSEYLPENALKALMNRL